MSDSVTILAARGRRLCKIIRASGTTVSYDRAKTFDIRERKVSSLADIYGLLAGLAGKPNCCVVRGAIADPGRTRRVRRLLYDNGEDRATLKDVPRRWAALDIDGAPFPKGVDAEDIFACGIAAVLTLPPQFHGAACIVQATGSHGLKPGMHLRVWCWLSRPASSAELAWWLRDVPHLDRASFSAVQLIYTTAPIFETGKDRVQTRLALMPGAATVRVPPPEALRPPAPPPAPPVRVGEGRGGRYTKAALTAAASHILGAGEGNRHRTILHESRGVWRLINAGLISEWEARRVIEYASRQAGKTNPTEFEEIWRWAAAHPPAGRVEINHA